jgi:hypothetical protein
MIGEPLDKVDAILKAQFRGQTYESVPFRSATNDIQLDPIPGPGECLDNQIRAFMRDQATIVKKPQVLAFMRDARRLEQTIEHAPINRIDELFRFASCHAQRIISALAARDQLSICAAIP